MTRGLLIATFSVIIPLTCIFVSILLSLDWFSIFDNALSDLGHAINSPVAPLFNLGLATGGVLMVIYASIHAMISWSLRVTISILGYLLVLIAVFDEVYGYIHFIVSALFFMTLLTFILLYALKLSKKTLILALAIVLLNIVAWMSYFSYRYTRGIAIPELVSISSAIPFYFHLALGVERSVKTTTK